MQLSDRTNTALPAVGSRAEIPLEQMRKKLSVPLLCDALDSFGYRRQAPRLPLHCMTMEPGFLLIGRCRTTLWADMAHSDPDPYKLELAAVDGCKPGDVLICAAAGSDRSGIWGELLSTAALHRGCAGVIVDGSVRDVTQMRSMSFPVFARGTNPYDSRDRQRVIDLDVVIEWDGIAVSPGDLVAADADGMVIVPKAIEKKVVQAAWEKSQAENKVREAIREGMSATEAFRNFGVL